MKRKNDIYFWATWILTGCLVLLVFYMYQKTFKFDEAIDLKTILGILGTLGGAYLGAAYAGKYALNSVKEQINYDRLKNENYEIERYKKTIPIISRYIDSLFNYIRQLKFLILENERGHNMYEIDFENEIVDEYKKILEIKALIEKIDIDLMTIEVNEHIQKIMLIITEIDTYLDTYIKGIDIEHKQARIKTIIDKIDELFNLFDNIQRKIRE